MKYAFVDPRISKEEKFNLSNLNCSVIECEPCNELYDAISGHPDILMHFLGNNDILLHKSTSIAFEAQLKALGFNTLRSKNILQEKYPNDIILNAVNTSTHFIHNLKFTDELLLNSVGNKILVDVKQGYTKCSTSVINDNAFITSDSSIYTSLKKLNLDVLYIPFGHISLPGLNYGFIGGTCGMIDTKNIAFYGSLEFYPYKNLVLKFLKKYDITPHYLSNSSLIDRGSILVIDTET